MSLISVKAMRKPKDLWGSHSRGRRVCRALDELLRRFGEACTKQCHWSITKARFYILSSFSTSLGVANCEKSDTTASHTASPIQHHLGLYSVRSVLRDIVPSLLRKLMLHWDAAQTMPRERPARHLRDPRPILPDRSSGP